MKFSVGAIILAAGASSRMGQTKQLLPIKGRPLLQHVIEKVAEEKFSEIIGIIGHESEKIKNTIPIADPRFQWVENNDYLAGQGSSLKKGMASIGQHHLGVMVFLGDLPFCSRETIHTIFEIGSRMLDEYKRGFVIQPVYKGKPGHPVFFGNVDRTIFMELSGDRGASMIMDKIPFRKKWDVEDEGIQFDIDTPETYLLAKNLE